MFMEKLFSFLPFGKKIIQKRKLKKFNTGLNFIRLFKRLIEESHYGSKDLIKLYHVIKDAPIDHSVIESIDKCFKISFYSVTSQNALEAVRKKQYYTETINNSNIVHLKTVDYPLNEWWSGSESIEFFISFMKDMILKAINLETSINREDYIREIGTVTVEEEEFINSILFRLLLTDFLTLILLLMENNHVETG